MRDLFRAGTASVAFSAVASAHSSSSVDFDDDHRKALSRSGRLMLSDLWLPRNGVLAADPVPCLEDPGCLVKGAALLLLPGYRRPVKSVGELTS